MPGPGPMSPMAPFAPAPAGERSGRQARLRTFQISSHGHCRAQSYGIHA
jgi:hypothetical protein